jgi:hypothetical protein
MSAPGALAARRRTRHTSRLCAGRTLPVVEELPDDVLDRIERVEVRLSAVEVLAEIVARDMAERLGAAPEVGW